MRVAKGPDGLAISRVNFNFALAKAEKCRTQKSSTVLHWTIIDDDNVANVGATDYTVGV